MPNACHPPAPGARPPVRRASRRSGAARYTTLCATLLLAALAVAPRLAAAVGGEAGGQTSAAASSRAASWARIEQLRSALSAHGNVEDADLGALQERLRLEREVGDRLGALIDHVTDGRDMDGAQGAAERERVRELLAAQDRTLHERIEQLDARIAAVRRARNGADAGALLDHEYRLRDLQALQNVLLADLLINARRTERVGGDAAARYAALDALLRTRAERLAGRLELALERLTTVRARHDAAAEAQRAELTLELAALEERRARLEHSLAALIELMTERGLDTSALNQLLFRATGQLSGDILDRRVLLGLLHDWLEQARTEIVENGPGWLFKLLVFALIVLLARLLAGVVRRLTARALATSRAQLSQLMQTFFVTVAANTVFGIGVLIALSQIGIELGPLLVGLGVAGFIVGFALQETLSNFAAGLMILMYRPFDLGDVVEAGGVSGVVKQLSLVSTTINTFDNQKLVVPNSRIWGDVIRNVNAEPTRRVDLTFGIGYGDDIARATRVLEDILASHELVLEEPAPAVRLHTLGESSIDFLVRPWVRTADYWTVYWDITRAVKARFDAEGISIPFPQRDVHLYRTEDAPAPGPQAAGPKRAM